MVILPLGRAALFSCLVIAAVLPRVVHAQAQPKAVAQAAPTPAQIDRNGVLILIRSALIALDQGNKTGNYTVLRDLGAPGFQTNTAARLAEIFVAQRKDNVDLSGVAVLEPQLNVLPQIEANGMLRMAGFFPSVPTQVNFELMFAPVNGQWRLFGISVNIGQSGPVAPNPPTPAAPLAAAQKQPAPGVNPNGTKQPSPGPAKPAPAVKLTPSEGKPTDNPQAK